VVNAVKLAADEWNAKGGVLGMKIEVVAADDQGNPQVGVAAGEKVAADAAIMGAVWGITSSTCIPVSEILEKVNMAIITPGCSNPKVTDRGLKVMHRLCARDDFQGPAGIIFAVKDMNAKKIAIFDDGTTGPRGAAARRKNSEGDGRYGTAVRAALRRQGLPCGARHGAEGRRCHLREPVGARRRFDGEAAARRWPQGPHDRP
jgi:ABC-type branched-subunit amino acid transport system substrate-binding protein